MAEPQGLRQRKKQRTYEAISNAAISLFIERGFEKVSVSEIAERAEVSKPTLFRYFTAKEDMALHLFADHEDESARTVRARATGESPLEALRQHFLRGLADRDPVTGLCDDERVLAFHRLLYLTPSLVARLPAYTNRSEAALADALREAAPATPLPELTAQLAAGQIIATQRILAMENWRRIADGATADAITESALTAAGHAFELLRTGLAAYR